MTRLALTRWLVSHTRRLMPVLGLAVGARILGQLAGVALLVVAVSALSDAWIRATLSSASPDSRTPEPLWPVVGALVGIALVKAALRYLEHYAGHWVAFTALQRLRDLFFVRLVPQAPAATRGRAGAELTQRATRDIDRIEVFFAHTLPPAVASVVVPAVALTWLGVAVDSALAGVAAVFVAASLAVPWLAGPATWAAARRTARRRGALAAHLGDDVQGLREVLAFDLADARLSSLDAASAELAAARLSSGRAQGLRAALGAALQLGSLVALLTVAGVVDATPSQLTMGAAVVVALWKPTQGIDDFVTGLDESFAAAERVHAVVEAAPRVADPADPAPAPSSCAVALDGVSLTYPGGSCPALDDVSLSFPAGSWSAVVGVSGSGKSTLAHLLPRGFDPDSGVVRLGGTDVARLSLDDLRSRVGFVAQRPTTLSGTLADNLRLAEPEASDEELVAALRVAALDDWLAGLPQGLETRIGERGSTLSGGQLQRIALARTLVARPSVLVLDEALSQLDGPTARVVRDRLAALPGPMTVIEITHRVDLLDDDAFVAILDAGQLVAFGAAAALRSHNEAFALLQARLGS
ncbi:MAG: ABC transporter ATP-binding protein [Tessaracoccus sp.]|uniref:amino acid ABC transporter ATP-binding/permease protein n=1 Tax=Tessaracoccus sp. TaxID=1971211 RepID=UPI001EC029EC|nr:ABC transporter ATP-binding protein [Tessaracoccus sp.]MBK7819516.1 ABC transporter ATP-binding protein [Tessaracoccus sp.]